MLMSITDNNSEARVVADKKTGAIRKFFISPSTARSSTSRELEAVRVQPMTKRSTADLAKKILQENTDKFHWKKEMPDLREESVIEGVNAFSARFTQTFKGLPVDSSNTVVNFDSSGRVYSIYNNYHYGIPEELDPGSIKITTEQAKKIVEELSQAYEKRLNKHKDEKVIRDA